MNVQSTFFTKLVCLCLGIFSMHLLQAQGAIKWAKDGNSYYNVQGGELIEFTLPQNSKTVLLTKEQLTPQEQKPLAFRSFSFSDDNKKVLLFTNTKKVWRLNTRGDYWVFDRNTNSLQQVGKGRPASSLMFAKLSPDGTKVAYVSEYNLYVEDLAGGAVKQLTNDGNRKLINGTFDWVYEEEFFCRDGFRWSPDSKQIAYWQIDAKNTKDYLMVNNTDSIYPFAVPVKRLHLLKWGW
jgi:dipeptidyl-peptidase-4